MHPKPSRYAVTPTHTCTHKGWAPAPQPLLPPPLQCSSWLPGAAPGAWWGGWSEAPARGSVLGHRAPRVSTGTGSPRQPCRGALAPGWLCHSSVGPVGLASAHAHMHKHPPHVHPPTHTHMHPTPPDPACTYMPRTPHARAPLHHPMHTHTPTHLHPMHTCSPDTPTHMCTPPAQPRIQTSHAQTPHNAHSPCTHIPDRTAPLVHPPVHPRQACAPTRTPPCAHPPYNPPRMYTPRIRPPMHPSMHPPVHIYPMGPPHVHTPHAHTPPAGTPHAHPPTHIPSVQAPQYTPLPSHPTYTPPRSPGSQRGLGAEAQRGSSCWGWGSPVGCCSPAPTPKIPPPHTVPGGRTLLHP